jgi:ABC-type oligopeptide transport system ATPase subunit
MIREALVVGINVYDARSQLRNLTSPAEDAEAIAEVLREYGGFQVIKTLPGRNREGQISRKNRVTQAALEAAIDQLFNPKTDNLENIPETALLFFSGHGLRRTVGIAEGYLATSDVNPDENRWGIRLGWLRRVLQKSPVRQQVIWLDCCHSGELLNFGQADLREADPGNLEARDRCFIAASRDFEAAYGTSDQGILTAALLQALDPNHRVDGLVTSLTLKVAVEQALQQTLQRPLCENSGNKIILTTLGAIAPAQPASGICPYKGLEYFDFNDEDPKYFHGRTRLTDELLEKVRKGNYLAVVGASGSGKSSVVRAGLLHQLKLGERVSGSSQWAIHIFRPDKHPLQSLARVFVQDDLSEIDRADQLSKAQALIDAGAIGLGQIITASKASRVVLVIDQFEECFTLCQDSVERQQFFDCLFGAVAQSEELAAQSGIAASPAKLCLVLTLRADFLGKCLEYTTLATTIETNLVTVKPMSRAELEQAITEPAKQVGLEVESELVHQMILDVEWSPGSLPLLQFTLTELWKRRSVNWLTLREYNRLGGVQGTLQRRADEVYAALTAEEQETAKRIFLELTQLGEGTEDTRRQVAKRDLVTSKRSETLLDRVIQRLSVERLVVTSELVGRSIHSDRLEVIDVAHEALIRHWPRLRQWIKDNRLALQQQRSIEKAAEEWLETRQSLEPAYLLQGPKLVEAELFLQNHADTLPLSSLAEELIRVSQTERDRQQRREQIRQRWKVGTAIAFPVMIAISVLMFALQQQHSFNSIEAIFLDTDTQRILDVLPTVLQQAHNQKAEVDRLANTASDEDAIAYYQTHKPEIDQSFAYYRQILRATGRLQQQIEQQPEALVTSFNHRETHSSTSQSIHIISQEAEASLAGLILKYRIPQLRVYLKQPNPEFGSLKEKSNTTDFEEQYTEGALRTTYEISMRGSGAGADLNNDGLIRDQQEAKQLPCKVLQEIERLWREATQGQCGWYGPKDENFNPNCKVLSEFGTLTRSVFDFTNDFPEQRLRSCGIPAPMSQNNGVKP